MATQKLQVVTPPTALTSSGSLTTGNTVLAGNFDNSSVLAPMVDVGLVANFGSAPTPASGIVVSLFLVPFVNSTNAPTVNTTGPVMPSSSFAGNFEITTNGSTAYLVVQGLQLSALKYNAYLLNQSGVTISSWTLTFNPTNWQY